MTEMDARVAEAIEREGAAVDGATEAGDTPEAGAAPDAPAEAPKPKGKRRKAALKETIAQINAEAREATPEGATDDVKVAIGAARADAIAEAKATAKAEAEAESEPEPEPEAVAPLEYVSLPVRLIRAALSVASKEETRHYLQGVHIAARDGMVRVCGTDGHRLFVGTVRPQGGTVLPDWLEAGVIISAEGLKPRLALLASDAEDPKAAVVRVGYAKDARHVELIDPYGSITFRQAPVDGTFPDYDPVIAGAAGALNDRAYEALEGASYQGRYVKAVGEMAAVIGAESVTFFAPPDNGASVVTFPDVPGAMLLLMPVACHNALPAATAALIGPNLKGTLAALKANLTRTEEALRHLPKDGAEAGRLTAKAGSLREKIMAVTEAATRAIAAPEKAAA